MIDALSAELLKLLRLRATWLLAWSYPILLLALGALVIAYGVVTGKPMEPPSDAAGWTAQSANFWLFPQTTFGRYLVASFAVFCTASEYGWNTWKLIVPARARWQLIAAKIIAAFALLIAAFLAADLIMLASALVGAAVVGPAIPAGVTVAALLAAHFDGFAAVLAPTLYTVVLATCLSVLTRSSLGALLLAVAFITIEGLFPAAALLAHGYAPGITAALAEMLPFHHLANIKSWCQEGRTLHLLLPPNKVVAPGFAHSLAVVGAWTAGLATLAVKSFDRQDLN